MPCRSRVHSPMTTSVPACAVCIPNLALTSGCSMTDWHTDKLTGTPIVIVEHRQDRPNQPAKSCPFCPGGLEAPEPYDVRWFANRWPSLPDGRSEVILYAPDHFE